MEGEDRTAAVAGDAASSTAANRLRITVAATAAARDEQADHGWTKGIPQRNSGRSERRAERQHHHGEQHQRRQDHRLRDGNRPVWVIAVSRTEATSAPRITAS